MSSLKQIAQKSNIAYILSLNPEILFGLSIQELPTAKNENNTRFSNKNSLTSLQTDYLYGLYMLLLFYGQKIHRDIIIGKAKDCIKVLQQQIERNQSALINRNSKNQILIMKMNKIMVHRTKCLRLLINQLYLNHSYNNQKLQQIRVNTAKQIKQIYKAFITIYKYQLTNKSFQNIGFQDPNKWLSNILGIKHRVINCYDFEITQFECQSYVQSDIEVYVQFNKEKKVYKYIRQKTQTIQTFNKIVKSHGQLKNLSLQNLMLYSDIIRKFTVDSSGFQFNNNSFLRLLRVESSREESISGMVSIMFSATGGGNTVIEMNSVILQESSSLNQSSCRRRSSSLPSTSVLSDIYQSQENFDKKTQKQEKVDKADKAKGEEEKDGEKDIGKDEQKDKQKDEEEKQAENRQIVEQKKQQPKEILANSFIFHESMKLQNQIIAQDKCIGISNVLTNQSQQDPFKQSISTTDNNHQSLQMKNMTNKQSYDKAKNNYENQNNLRDQQIKKNSTQDSLEKSGKNENMDQKCSNTKKRCLQRKYQDKIDDNLLIKQKNKKYLQEQTILKNIFSQKGINSDTFSQPPLSLTKSASLSKRQAPKICKPSTISYLKQNKLQYSN